MSDDTKEDCELTPLVPGEPVEQFGGMTPEEMTSFASKIETCVLTTFGSIDGALTLYAHLSARLLLDIEEASGATLTENEVLTFQIAMRAEMDKQRKVRAQQAVQEQPIVNGYH